MKYCNLYTSVSIFVLLTCVSCKKFLDVNLSDSKVISSVVFKDDNTASSAIIGVYYDLATNTINNGEVNSMSRLAGLSSDELTSFYDDPSVFEFQFNNLTAENANVALLWNSLYKVIYNANGVLEGLAASGTISAPVKNRLSGEALFLRAFCNFNLVNFFGSVPIVTGTDYRVNSTLARQPVSEVYKHILDDLKLAETLLPSEYIGSDRVRANSGAATALLAKVYLFLGDWQNAETSSSTVINSSDYGIVDSLNEVFQKTSHESIWQISTIYDFNSTIEALYYTITDAPVYLVLRNEYVNSFEVGDRRLSKWIGSISWEGEEIYFPQKYKLNEEGEPAKQYSAVLRLAEQYLIRAEARVMMNNIPAAISDVDEIRKRAGLALIADQNPTIDRDTLLEAIAKEKKSELFTEWTIRWFDLNRTKTAANVLSAYKPDFTLNDSLYPIPQFELNRNPNLGEQNEGY